MGPGRWPQKGEEETGSRYMVKLLNGCVGGGWEGRSLWSGSRNLSDADLEVCAQSRGCGKTCGTLREALAEELLWIGLD